MDIVEIIGKKALLEKKLLDIVEDFEKETVYTTLVDIHIGHSYILNDFNKKDPMSLEIAFSVSLRS